MDRVNWRTQLPPDSRQKITNKIFETLNRHLPVSEPEGINELKKIAARFEDKVFRSAVNQIDYLRQISGKMLTLETKSQNAAASSPSFLAASNNSIPLVLDMDNENSEPSPLNGEPPMNTCDWRSQLLPDSRQKNINQLMETLKKHVPYSGQEGIEELRRIAVSFEEMIFNTAINQTDYLRKISLEMLSIETTVRNAADSSTSIPDAYDSTPLNSGDWRTHQSLDSRQKNINKLVETLKKHVPHSGQEGIDELMRIAVSFEELIFNTAITQVDYFRKISLKMVAVEEGN
ncbi:Mediator of RNA polymerase II transcription subunit 15a [Cardamine amara subsp. amara]|uniref:Mediator of RNA polymerase II transcription subunit 15a n=1 Tax=Cardamine amara subsp. amara TaxID=228776 RepID=A0ABD1BV25_CARAN